MPLRRPLYVAANGTPTMIAAPDTIDPAILPDGGPGASLHAAQQAISSLTQQWRCNDAPGTTTLANTKGAAVLTAGSDVTLGTGGLLNDGATSAFLGVGGTAGSTGGHENASLWTAPGVLPTVATTPWSVEFLATPPQNSTYYVAIGGTSAANVLLGTNATSIYYGVNAANAGSGTGAYNGGVGGRAQLIQLTWDGTTLRLYVNGTLTTFSSTAVIAMTGLVQFGCGYAGAGGNPLMRVQNIAIYSAALTQTQIFANVAAALL